MTIAVLRNGALVKTLTTGATIGSAGAGSYKWSPAKGYATGGGYQIRVTVSGSSPAVGDTSDGTFTIT